jgi:DNA-binding response OmpR family regulator
MFYEDPSVCRTWEKGRILIVEDEPVVAETLGKILSASGYETRIAHSAETALEILSVWSPRLAILDVMLPKMNGIDLAVSLKRNLPGCGVLLFSGQPSAEALLQKASEEGHQFQILAKPVHPNVVLRAISNLLCRDPCAQN